MLEWKNGKKNQDETQIHITTIKEEGFLNDFNVSSIAENPYWLRVRPSCFPQG